MLVCLFSFSMVNAETANDINIDSNNHDSNLMTESVNENALSMSLSDSETLGSADNGTFTDLQKKIDGADEGSTISLENNYTYDVGFSTDGIFINKTLTINGNGYVIDALGQSRIFNVNSSAVTLNDIVFIIGGLAS